MSQIQLAAKGPFPLEALASIAEATLRAELADRLLVRRLTESDRPNVRGQVQTVMATPQDTAALLGAGSVLIYPVRKAPGTITPKRMISVGRTNTSDITIEDASVSLFQAAFHVQENELYLHDGESTNGTLLNGKRVPNQEEGDALLVQPGDTIVFGAIHVRVVDAAGLAGLARTLARAASL